MKLKIESVAPRPPSNSPTAGVVSGASGYKVYRNGALLTTVDASTTSYHDEAPLGMDLTYEVEAYNIYGIGPRVSASVPACK